MNLPSLPGISKNSDFLRETLWARLDCAGLHPDWFEGEKIPRYLHGKQRAWPRCKLLIKHPWGQDQRWLLVCLQVCVICFHKALIVFSRELRATSFKTVSCIRTAIPTICLVCSIQTTHKCHTRSFSQKFKMRKKKVTFVRWKEYYSGNSLLKPNSKKTSYFTQLNLSEVRMGV